jgi:hypothetical protein
LKKSPTGSALADHPLKKKSATTGRQIQREPMRHLIELSAFNVEVGFSARIGAKEKKNLSARTKLSTLVNHFAIAEEPMATQNRDRCFYQNG